MTFSVESVICRLAGSCMSGHLPAVLSHVSWKNDLPGSKAVTVLGREVTNICICAFKVGSFGSLLSGWMATHARTIGIWPIPRKTSYKIIFIDFFVDFSDFARTAENPFMEPSRNLSNTVKRDKNCTKIAGFTVCLKKKWWVSNFGPGRFVQQCTW